MTGNTPTARLTHCSGRTAGSYQRCLILTHLCAARRASRVPCTSRHVCPSSLGVSVLHLTTTVTVPAAEGPSEALQSALAAGLAQGGRVLERATALLLAEATVAAAKGATKEAEETKAAVEVWHLSFALPVPTITTGTGEDAGSGGEGPCGDETPCGLAALPRLRYQPDPWPQLAQARAAFGRLFPGAPFLVQEAAAARAAAIARGEDVDAAADEDALAAALASADAADAAEAAATAKAEAEKSAVAALALRVALLEAAAAGEEGRLEGLGRRVEGFGLAAWDTDRG